MMHNRKAPDKDLIDTQWNVNSFLANWQVSRQADLIDTQWNVNAGEVIGVYHDKDGFNRYIVECKLLIDSGSYSGCN